MKNFLKWNFKALFQVGYFILNEHYLNYYNWENKKNNC